MKMRMEMRMKMVNGKWQMVMGNMNSGVGLDVWGNNLSISSSISVVFLDSCLVLFFLCFLVVTTYLFILIKTTRAAVFLFSFTKPTWRQAT